MLVRSRAAFLSLGIGLLFPLVTHAQWDCAWPSRLKLSFNNLDRAETLRDFPVLVSLDPAEVGGLDLGASVGAGIRFVDGDRSTELPFEVESWDPVADTASVWVKVPAIDGSSDADHIWLYYGHRTSPDGQDTAGVWSPNHQSVFHLGETSGLHLDSTVNDLDATAVGGVDQDAQGWIGGGDEFDGVDDYLWGATPGPELWIRGDVTLETWVRLDAYPGASGWGLDASLIEFSAVGEETAANYLYQLGIQDNGDVAMGHESGSGTNRFQEAGVTLELSRWYHLTAVRDTTARQWRLFVDGAAAGSAFDYPADTSGGSTGFLWIARANRYIDGVLDEVRISDTARSADWIAAQYASMTGSFVSYGAVASLSVGNCFLGRATTVPTNPQDVAFGDLDGDGRSDMVVAHPDLDAISVSLATGPETFAPAVLHPAGPQPRAIRLADMDRDGRLDAVVVGRDEGLAEGRVSILEGDAAGGFTSPRSFPAGSDPVGIVLIDTDRNEHLDLVVADAGDDQLVVLLQEVPGVFVETSFIPLSSSPAGLALGDLDGDSRSDLVVCLPQSAGIAVLLAEDGLSATTFYAAGSQPIAVALGDLDDDGALDVVLADPPSDSILVLMGDGLGGIAEQASYPTGRGPVGVVLAELDGDCALDVATVNAGSDDVSTMPGDGMGAIGEASSLPVGSRPGVMRVVDVEADGEADLAVSLPDRDEVVTLLDETVRPLDVDVDACGVTHFLFDRAEAISHPDVDQYVLDFGDGSRPRFLASLGPEGETHTYITPATYRVTLTAESATRRCLARAELEVDPTPVAAADAGGPYWQCLDAVSGDACYALDGSASSTNGSGSIVSFLWELLDSGGGEIGWSESLEYCLDASEGPQTQTLRLTVADSDGCLSSSTTQVSLRELGDPTVTASEYFVCADTPVTLAAEPGHESYLWSTGETTASIVASPIVTTTYSVQVADEWGCSADASVEIEVDPDTPPATEVSGLRLVEGPSTTVLVTYSSNGAPVYQLYRADRGVELGAAPVHQEVEGHVPFADTPPDGQHSFYAVRGASRCTRQSGP